MIVKEIFGNNRTDKPSKERVGARGIVLCNDKILLVYEQKTDFYMIPGGGLEQGETENECCIREIEEETGYIVSINGSAFLELNEYYGDCKYTGYYYICEVNGHAHQRLTDIEKSRNMIAKWVGFEKAKEIFSYYKSYETENEEKSAEYLREYTALCSIMF